MELLKRRGVSALYIHYAAPTPPYPSTCHFFSPLLPLLVPVLVHVPARVAVLVPLLVAVGPKRTGLLGVLGTR